MLNNLQYLIHLLEQFMMQFWFLKQWPHGLLLSKYFTTAFLASLMPRSFKIGNVLCCIVSYTSLLVRKICVPFISMACPYCVSGHNRLPPSLDHGMRWPLVIWNPHHLGEWCKAKLLNVRGWPWDGLDLVQFKRPKDYTITPKRPSLSPKQFYTSDLAFNNASTCSHVSPNFK